MASCSTLSLFWLATFLASALLLPNSNAFPSAFTTGQTSKPSSVFGPIFPRPKPPHAPSPSPSPSPSPMASPILPPSHGIKSGYWLSSRAKDFPPLVIRTSYFTHIFYAFVQLDPSSYEVLISDVDTKWMKNFTATLHAKNPMVKALLSVGGIASNSSVFAALAGNFDNHGGPFLGSVIGLAQDYGFDGIDFDWEFPASPQNMSNLSHLLEELQVSLELEHIASGRQKLLPTAAVYFAAEFFLSNHPTTSYPGNAMRDYLDFVNVICFDYHGSWDTTATAEHSLLYDKASNISTSDGISTWVKSGVPPKNLVMGLPLYGRTWTLKDPSENGIGAPAVGIGPGKDGVMTYDEVVEFNEKNGSTVVYDPETVSTYSYAGTSWVGHDGQTSTENKVKFAKELGLGGYFLWALGYDDQDWTLSQTGNYQYGAPNLLPSTPTTL